MTTGIQCRADPRCEEPAPPETGICHCHAKQAKKGRRDDPQATPGRLVQAGQVPRAGQGAGAMTEITIRTRVGIAARISGWVGRRQQELSDRVHAAGDAAAWQHGWTVTECTGRLGFAARSYRDPRFNNRRQQLARSEQDAAMPSLRRRSGRPETQKES